MKLRLQHVRALGLLAAALVLFAGIAPRADRLILKDGRQIEGKILEQSTREVLIHTAAGELRYPMSEIAEVIREKTREEIYQERLNACKSADDYWELGLWCVEQRLRKRAEKLYRRALELDADHEGAREELGFVRHEGEWMRPEERDRRVREAFEARMREQGRVRHGDRWVSAEEKEKLERGLVLHEGEWMEPEEVKRAEGLELFEGEWLPRTEAQARHTVAGAERAAGRSLRYRIGDATLLCGTIARKELRKLEPELERALGWFVDSWQVESALRLFGNRPCEIYLFDDDDAYVRTVDWLASRSDFIPPGWTQSVKAGYGFVWTDPIAISSARQRKRPFAHLIGHSHHNFGHLMLNSLGYRGRLLPAWYDEGVAALTELRTHGSNVVFCRSSFQEGQGSSAGGGRLLIESSSMRDGSWRRAMKEALEARRIDSFDRLSQREFSQLELVDIAASMAIVEWLESRGGATLSLFHEALRKGAPPAPTRVILDGRRRRAYYDTAFDDALGMKTKEADAAWRSWFLSR